MSKRILFILTAVVGTLLTACSQEDKELFLDDSVIANQKLEEFLTAIQSGDKEEVISLFSIETRRSTAGFEDSVDELLEYYEGEYISDDDWGGPVVSKSRDEESYITIFETTYEIVTSECEYRLAFKYVHEDDSEPFNRGIEYIYIIKTKDDINTDFAYYGDGKDTPGINIGVVSEE